MKIQNVLSFSFERKWSGKIFFKIVVLYLTILKYPEPSDISPEDLH